ncbi:MAG: hypothetical protein NTX17_01895 [Candidatus Eisenbacteria bacterium]|nr:hypothetical protein [Candidatus Eisenbacteria bacterium]
MRKFITLAVLACCAAGVTQCAKTITFPVSVLVPAAQAKAQISLDKNGNTQIDLKVNYLAPPQNLTPPKATYILWLQTPDNQIVGLGQLTVGSDRKGEVKGVTQLKEFRLFVTAEDDPAAASPGQQVILTTGFFTVG